MAEIVSGGTPKSGIVGYWDGDVPWVTPKDLSDLRGSYISASPRTISQDGLRESSASLLPANSVLFSSRAPIGHVAINTVPMATNQGFKSFVPAVDQLESKYLYHWLKANRRLLEGLGNGATFKEVSKSVVSKVQIPLPPLPEQRRIAAILDHADTLRAKRRETIARLDELSAAIFIDMFADTEPGWNEVTIADLALPAKGSIRTGPFGSQLLHEEFTSEGVAVLGIDNAVKNRFEWAKPRFITPAKYEQLKRYKVFAGDVLVTIMGTNGRCAVVPDNVPEAINTKHLCCITPDTTKVTSEFLHSYFLRHPQAQSYLQRTAKGAIMSGLNMGIIKSMPVVLPPLGLQERYGTVVSQVGRRRADLDTSLARLDSLFSSLQSRAFRGEL